MLQIKIKKGYEEEEVLEKALRGIRKKRMDPDEAIRDPYLRSVHQESLSLYDTVVQAMIAEIIDNLQEEQIVKSLRKKPKRIKIRLKQ